MKPAFALILVASLLVAGCSAPASTVEDVSTQGVSGSPGNVGGSVTNAAPYVASFTQSATTGENRGAFNLVLSGQIRDNNTERDISNISIVGRGPVALGANHAVTPPERAQSNEPATFGADGFKVWDATRNDGLLDFRYQQAFAAFAPAGVYTFQVFASDAPGGLAASAPLTVTITSFADITIGATPVSAAGETLTGRNWGEWSAAPGATNVESTNYLKLVNTGDAASTRVVIDFASAFVGASDANFTIPANSNLQFAWCEDTTPATSAPNECSLAYGATSPDGTVTVSFSAKSNVVYVTYRIVQLPSLLPVQSYGISFTVTEL